MAVAAILAPEQELASINSAIFEAGERAYAALTREGYPEAEVHRMSLCYDAAALMVGALTDAGYKASHDIYANPIAGEHSTVSVQDPYKGEVIADPTWQQFLPSTIDGSNMPKVLVGPRSAVTAQARIFGVRPEALGFWQGAMPKTNPVSNAQANREAAVAATQAADAGKWEKFMAAAR